MTKQEVDAIRDEIEWAYRHDTWARISPERVENLLAEIDRLEKERLDPIDLTKVAIENKRMKVEIDRLKTERSMMIEDMRLIADNVISKKICYICGYYVDGHGCNDPYAGLECHWQWRGIERERGAGDES